MKQFTKETLIDKSIDIAVVVFGILIALSIDSYKEDYKQYKQWKQFSSHFLRDAKESKPKYEETIRFFEEKNANVQKYITAAYKDRIDKKSFELFIQKLSETRIFYPDDVHYQALVSSGNEYLLKKNDTLKALGSFYNFKISAQINLTMYSDHVLPKYLTFLENYYSRNFDLKKDKGKVIYFLELYRRFSEQNVYSYKIHLKNTESLIKILEPES